MFCGTHVLDSTGINGCMVKKRDTSLTERHFVNFP